MGLSFHIEAVTPVVNHSAIFFEQIGAYDAVYGWFFCLSKGMIYVRKVKEHKINIIEIEFSKAHFVVAS